MGKAGSKHIEIYLKAIGISVKEKEIKVSSIAKLLNMTQPFVVQMLHKISSGNLVN